MCSSHCLRVFIDKLNFFRNFFFLKIVFSPRISHPAWIRNQKEKNIYFCDLVSGLCVFVFSSLTFGLVLSLVHHLFVTEAASRAFSLCTRAAEKAFLPFPCIKLGSPLSPSRFHGVSPPVLAPLSIPAGGFCVRVPVCVLVCPALSADP